MLKIIFSKSEIKKHFKECQKKRIPCVTVQFHETNASIRGDFDSAGVELSPEQREAMQKEEKQAIDQYRPLIKNDFSFGRYPDIKIHASAAYKLAQELATIMCKYAGLDPQEYESKFPVALVISTTDGQCKVLCPYCGKYHYHGKVSVGSHVLSHCLVKDPEDRGYIIKPKR